MMDLVGVPASLCAAPLCRPGGPASGLAELGPLQRLGSHSHGGHGQNLLPGLRAKGHSQNTPQDTALCLRSAQQASRMECVAHGQVATEATGAALPAPPPEQASLPSTPLTTVPRPQEARKDNPPAPSGRRDRKREAQDMMGWESDPVLKSQGFTNNPCQNKQRNLV